MSCWIDAEAGGEWTQAAMGIAKRANVRLALHLIDSSFVSGRLLVQCVHSYVQSDASFTSYKLY